MNKDSDLIFKIPTENKVLFIRGGFKSHFDFYISIYAGFGIDFKHSLPLIMDNIILVREHYLNNLN